MHPDSLFSPKQSDVLTVMTWPLSSLWGQALKECVSDALFLPNGILEKYEHGLWREKFNQIFNV